MIVNQWLAAAHKGDAIGDSARRFRDLLRGLGHESELFALTIDKDLESLLEEGVPVYYVREDAQERGVPEKSLIDGAKAVSSKELPSLVAGFEEARRAGGHFCLATHYWEVDAAMKNVLLRFLDYAARDRDVRFVAAEELFA